METRQKTYLKQGAFIMLIGVIGGYLAEYCLNLLVSNSMDADAYGDYRVA